MKLGPFTTNNCVMPAEEDEYAQFGEGLRGELHPSSPLQEVHAAEIVLVAWGLRRCAMAEERLGWRSEWRQEDLNRKNNEDLPPADPSIANTP